MNRILLFCALGALWGCRQAAELSGEAITLSCSTSESAKVGALTAGDAVAVFARVEGTEDYFLEAAKYGVGSDGHSLTYGSTVYYPDTKQAVNFYAYFPYHTGSFSVPSDQSIAAALKQADLCWANASSTPVATPVSLTFQHLFARLIVQTNEPTSKIACTVVPSGVLNAATAQFTLNNNKSEIFTTGNELILPVQPLSRLIITVSGVEYVFEGSINLQPGQTTTLNLTLHPSTQTATLSGSSTTAWIASSQSGSLEQTVSNILTLHWANYVPQGPTPDKITLTINNTDYTISSGITYANKTFTVPFASAALRYPYTISKIAVANIPPVIQLLGNTIYKSGTQTIGVNDPTANAVLIGGLWWATGTLVSNGPNSCRIGAPTDCGLYFQFGSLIGWSGGAAPNYNGTGKATNHPATIKVTPSELLPAYNPGTIWPIGGATSTLDKSYFSLTVSPWNIYGSDINSYTGAPTSGDQVDLTRPTLLHGRYRKMGVGDPCRRYLGEPWRLPTLVEVANLYGFAPGDAGFATCSSGITYDNAAYAHIIVKEGKTLTISKSSARAGIAAWNNGHDPATAPYSNDTPYSTLNARGPLGAQMLWSYQGVQQAPNQVIVVGSDEPGRHGASRPRCVAVF